MTRRRAPLVGGLLVAALVLLTGALPAAAADGDHDGVPNRRDRCPAINGSRPDGCPDGRWRLRDTNSAGPADVSFVFGSLAWTPLGGDWDGDATETSGLYDPANGRWRQFELTQTVNTFTFRPGAFRQLPIVGDWDGNGTDTVGMYQPSTGTFFLKNSNTSGPADLVFSFGGASNTDLLRPVAGDWDGNGTDTVGLYKRDTHVWRLRNFSADGPPDVQFTFGTGPASGRPVVGDWNNDNVDTVGVVGHDNLLVWHLRNTNSAGPADLEFDFGVSTGTPVVGDWNGDHTTTIAVRRR